MTFIKEFILIFNQFIFLLVPFIVLLGLISLIIVFTKNSLSPKERVYHHLIGTVNIMFFSQYILVIICNFYFKEFNLDRLPIFLCILLLICGIFTNLRCRNKI
jgi:hypothetical protein